MMKHPKSRPTYNPDTWRALKRPTVRSVAIIEFIESLFITSGIHAGQPFKLRPWQKKIIRDIYAVDRSGKRRIRTALISMPRKNGKTQLSAALALAHLLGPAAEERGGVFSAAADRQQAGLIFQEMCAFIQNDADLAERVKIRHLPKEIESLESGSVYRALSSDARKAHGLNVSFAVCDELAQWRTRELLDNIQTGTSARDQPLVVIISTQSPGIHHVMSELIRYADQVAEGALPPDPAFHATIYRAPMDADPWDESVWHACNPALGDFRSLDEMRDFAEQAKRLPAKETVFRSLYLNQPVADEAKRFLRRSDWEACSFAVDEEELAGQPCWAGLDMSSTTDLTALVLYFENGAVLPYFWCPQEALEVREHRDKVPYLVWNRQGYLLTTPGRVVDKLAVVAKLAQLAGRYQIRGLAYDRWRLEDLRKLLVDEGVNVPLVPFGQGFKDMSPALDALENRVLTQRLRHGGHPILRWNAANAVATKDAAGNTKLDKSKAAERIDGLIALCMAVGLSARQARPQVIDIQPLVLSFPVTE
jgi:phage terminase large subunit-like protein